MDAATFVAGFVLVATLVRGGGAIVDTDETRGLTEGLRFVVRDSLLRGWCFNAPTQAIVMLRTPRALCAKVWSVVIVMTAALGPPLLAATGPALEWAGLRPTLAVLLGLQSVAVAWFTTAGLRERARSQQLMTEAAA